jgi:hypothetical protein
MSPLLQEKLLDLLVNIVAIILGGGLITLVIEWRRHRREMQNWKKEDETIQIDIPVARITPYLWAIGEKTTDKQKLEIYENKLENTIKTFVIYSEFVIRNTTPAEIIVRQYNAEVSNIPYGQDVVDYYDLESFDRISQSGAIRLKAFATIPCAVVYVARFDKDRKLERESLPNSLSISVETSDGKVIQHSENLRSIKGLVGVVLNGDRVLPIRYFQKFVLPDDDIPF